MVLDVCDAGLLVVAQLHHAGRLQRDLVVVARVVEGLRGRQWTIIIPAMHTYSILHAIHKDSQGVLQSGLHIGSLITQTARSK